MWRIVCIGPGPRGLPRRIVDRGPLLVDEQRAHAIAAWLKSTGLYESVRVARSAGVITRP